MLIIKNNLIHKFEKLTKHTSQYLHGCFNCLPIYTCILGLQSFAEQLQRSNEQMQRSMEQMQRSMEQMQRLNKQMERSLRHMHQSMEDIKLENRRFVNIGSEMDQEIEGQNFLCEL